MVAADSSHDGSNVGETCTIDNTTLLNSEVGKPSLEGIQSKEIAATGLSNDNDDNIHMEIGKIDFNNGVCQETTESDDRPMVKTTRYSFVRNERPEPRQPEYHPG